MYNPEITTNVRRHFWRFVPEFNEFNLIKYSLNY